MSQRLASPNYNDAKINNKQNFAPHLGGAKKTGSGGHNIQKYYLNVKTFKSLCLTVPTEKILNNKLDKYRIEEIARNRKEYKSFILSSPSDQTSVSELFSSM